MHKILIWFSLIGISLILHQNNFKQIDNNQEATNFNKSIEKRIFGISR